MSKNALAEIMFYDQDLKVSASPEVITWLSMSRYDPDYASQHEAPRGKVYINPINRRGGGQVMKYPDAESALSFFRKLFKVPLSVFYPDRKTNRFIWRAPVKGRDGKVASSIVYIDLSRSLTNHSYIDGQLEKIMEFVGISKKDRSTVFGSKHGKSDSGNGKESAPQTVPEEHEDILLEDLGIDARTVSSLNKDNIVTLENLQDFVEKNGGDQLVSLEGIGPKSSQQLLEILEEQTEPA